MSRPKLAVIYHGNRDKNGNIEQTRLWLDKDGARAPGYVMCGQVFLAKPYDARESTMDVRHYFGIQRYGVGGTGIPQAGEKEAREWLLEGITLTPTCRKCGLAEDRHTKMHAFTASAS